MNSLPASDYANATGTRAGFAPLLDKSFSRQTFTAKLDGTVTHFRQNPNATWRNAAVVVRARLRPSRAQDVAPARMEPRFTGF
jgi:hypothetical protein